MWIYRLVMSIVSTRSRTSRSVSKALTDLGYGGLKLAEVCNRLGVTTGSFYHHFPSWSAYTRELVAFWVQDRTVRLIERSGSRRIRGDVSRSASKSGCPSHTGPGCDPVVECGRSARA